MAQTKEWNVHLDLFEDDKGATKAHVALDTGTTALTGRGSAHCNPADTDMPEIGDELATGWAVQDLAQQLLKIAERDIQGPDTPRPEDHQTAG